MPYLMMSAANANPDWYLSSAQYGYPNVSGANKGVILEIRRERAVELNQEGFRFNDSTLEIRNQYQSGTLWYVFQTTAPMTLRDGVADYILYAEGTSKPTALDGVQVLQLGKDILLTEGDHGYVYYHKNISRTPFNEGRDYLYPIPINERSLNKNLTQNPGWNDGLDF